MDEDKDNGRLLNNDGDNSKLVNSGSSKSEKKKKQDIICLEYLNGFCGNMLYCQFHHVMSKFVWQWKAGNDNPWVNLLDDLNDDVEESFSCVKTDGAVISNLWVDFNNKDESGNFLTEGSATDTIFRRLSTPSSILSTDVGATKWKWYVKSTTTEWTECSQSADIEGVYCSGQSYFQFREGSDMHCILFDEMIQINIDNPNSIQCKVRRRPVFQKSATSFVNETSTNNDEQLTSNYLFQNHLTNNLYNKSQRGEDEADTSHVLESNIPPCTTNQQAVRHDLHISGLSANVKDSAKNDEGACPSHSLARSSATNTSSSLSRAGLETACPSHLNSSINQQGNNDFPIFIISDDEDDNDDELPSYLGNKKIVSNKESTEKLPDSIDQKKVNNEELSKEHVTFENLANEETTPPSLQFHNVTSTSTSASKDSKYPLTWPNECPAGHLIDVTGSSKREIESKFLKTMQSSGVTVISVQEVCNHDVFDKYMLKKNQFTKKGKDCGEKFLYHGTSPKNIPMICSQNFDFRVSGTNGTAFGKGTYFATSANYSHSYSSRSMGFSPYGQVYHNEFEQNGYYYMFVGQVLTGKFTPGRFDYTRPPPLCKDSLELFDSCVDRVNNPSMFIIFDRDQCYPRYLIKYRADQHIRRKKRKSNSSPSFSQIVGNKKPMLPHSSLSNFQSSQMFLPSGLNWNIQTASKQQNSVMRSHTITSTKKNSNTSSRQQFVKNWLNSLSSPNLVYLNKVIAKPSTTFPQQNSGASHTLTSIANDADRYSTPRQQQKFDSSNNVTSASAGSNESSTPRQQQKFISSNNATSSSAGSNGSSTPRQQQKFDSSNNATSSSAGSSGSSTPIQQQKFISSNNATSSRAGSNGSSIPRQQQKFISSNNVTSSRAGSNGSSTPRQQQKFISSNNATSQRAGSNGSSTPRQQQKFDSSKSSIPRQQQKFISSNNVTSSRTGSNGSSTPRQQQKFISSNNATSQRGGSNGSSSSRQQQSFLSSNNATSQRAGSNGSSSSRQQQSFVSLYNVTSLETGTIESSDTRVSCNSFPSQSPNQSNKDTNEGSTSRQRQNSVSSHTLSYSKDKYQGF